LSAIINEVVPWEGGVPLGTLAEIMIANRLLAPEPLWAKKGSVWAKKGSELFFVAYLARK
jgi:hypothetical protein